MEAAQEAFRPAILGGMNSATFAVAAAGKLMLDIARLVTGNVEVDGGKTCDYM